MDVDYDEVDETFNNGAGLGNGADQSNEAVDFRNALCDALEDDTTVKKYDSEESDQDFKSRRRVDLKRLDDAKYPLHTACIKGDLVTVSNLIEKEHYDVNSRDCSNYTPLKVAVNNYSNSTELVKLLLGYGADIHVEGCENLLTVAIEHGHFETAKILVQSGFGVNKPDKEGYTPLQVACHESYLEMIYYLVEMGADLNVKDKNGATLLMNAAQFADPEVIEYLLNRLNINDRDNNGNNAVHYAMCSFTGDKLALAKLDLLVRSGAHVNICNKLNMTPIFNAVANGHKRAFKRLLELGADIRIRLKHTNNNILHYMCGRGFHGLYARSIIRKIISLGININDRDNSSGRTALHMAVINKTDSMMLKYLISLGADIEARDNLGMTPILLCGLDRSRESCNIEHTLAAEGANIHVVDNQKNTILHYAASNSNVEWMDHYDNINVNAKNAQGRTALHEAVIHDFSFLERLLQCGADTTITDNAGKTAIDYAVAAGDDRMILRLTKYWN